MLRKNMRSLVLLCCFLVLHSVNAQRSFNLYDEVFREHKLSYIDGDTISFLLVESAYDLDKPTVFYLPGSLPKPLIYEFEDGYQMIVPFQYFDTKALFKNYNVILVGKPFTPIHAREIDLVNDMSVPDKSKPNCFDLNYLRCDNLDYLGKRIDFLINSLLEKKMINDKRIIVMGHSQGGREAPRIAALNKKVTDIVVLSASPYGRIQHILTNLFRDVLAGKRTFEDFQEYRAMMLEDFKSAFEKSDSLRCDRATYENLIRSFLNSWLGDHLNLEDLAHYPSIRFGIETAILDLKTGGKQKLFDTPFTRGLEKIRINGLIWMGSSESMSQQIAEKLEAGFRCIKMKIGAIPWEEEFRLLAELRNNFSANDIEIRVDANGAYSPDDAPRILENLASLEVHSIEQPIKAGQWDAMAKLCQATPCPIALDEELIGIYQEEKQSELLDHIRPQYIILKPSLHGGISGTQQWISAAQALHIPWWITSALESNLGLNAIAQLASSYKLKLPQGLGTGSLYVKNIPSPLHLEGEWLKTEAQKPFDFDAFFG